MKDAGIMPHILAIKTYVIWRKEMTDRILELSPPKQFEILKSL